MGNFINNIFIDLNIFAGIGILTLPYVVQETGYILSSVLIFLIAIVVVYTIKCLIDLSDDYHSSTNI